jgi:hypothetical protein
MMNINRVLIVACLCWFASVQGSHASGLIAALGGGRSEEFGSTKVLYWDRTKGTPEAGIIGGVAINYGRPSWKRSYANPEVFDRLTKGEIWRFGKGFWTVLDTNVPLTMGNRKIDIGHHYLGIHRSDDGSEWSLAFIDPAKARKAHLDAFQIAKAPVDFRVPLEFSETEEHVDKLTVKLSYAADSPERLRMVIAWGKLRLSAPIEAGVVVSP